MKQVDRLEPVIFGLTVTVMIYVGAFLGGARWGPLGVVVGGLAVIGALVLAALLCLMAVGIYGNIRNPEA
jgi:amino acid transporter